MNISSLIFKQMNISSLLQVLGKISTFWITRPQSRQGWLPQPLRQREPLNPKTFQLLLLPSPEGERQIKNVEKRKQPQISARALRRNWILSLRGFPLRLFNVLFMYSSLLTIRESLFLQAFFFSKQLQKNLGFSSQSTCKKADCSFRGHQPSFPEFLFVHRAGLQPLLINQEF